MWATRDAPYSGMKWHLADPSSVEIYGEELGWGEFIYVVERISVVILCADSVKSPNWNVEHARLDGAKIKESLKLSQANICVFCKKERMEELGLDDYPI